MKIPKKITPDPIFSAVIEARFNSSINDDDDVVGVFYPIFSDRYPKLKTREPNIPKEVRNQMPEFEYFAGYIMLNDNFSILFGRNIFAIEVTNLYCGWEVFFKEIKYNFELIKNKELIDDITRIGLRYRNIFKNESSIQKILKYKLNLDSSNRSYEQKINSFVSEFKTDGITLLLQIIGEVEGKKINKESDIYKGLYLDIDAYSNKLKAKIDNNFFELIDKLHTEEKNLFFESLDETYLKTLNPEY